MKRMFLTAAAAIIAVAPALAKEATYTTGTGKAVVIAVDVAAGEIRLSHGPIPALNWPAMTMSFTGQPDLLRNVAVGDKVAITIRSGGGHNEITSIAKQ